MSERDASGGRRDQASVAGTGPARLTVGLVRGFRGLHGHVRVELLTDRPEDRFVVGAPLFPEGDATPLTIAEATPVADGPGWWLRFHELRDRSSAETLRDRYLEIDAPDEPREPGRWFVHELVGLAVRSTAGEDLGTVIDLYPAGGADVFVVRGPRGELDVPGVQGIVTDLAPDRGELIVDLDALDLDARPVEDESYVRPRDRRPKKQPKAAKTPKTPNAPTSAKAPKTAEGPKPPKAPKPDPPGPASPPPPAG